LNEPASLAKLLKRPELNYEVIEVLSASTENLSERVKQQVEVECKYEGYLRRQLAEAQKFKHMERIEISADFCYAQIPGLSNEIKQKLEEVRPSSLGQASRIPGVTPAAISVLLIYMKRFKLIFDSGHGVITRKPA